MNLQVPLQISHTRRIMIYNELLKFLYLINFFIFFLILFSKLILGWLLQQWTHQKQVKMPAINQNGK